MKKLTFTVPCYNSAAYMDRCIDSLLICGDDAEIIIVNDGSVDETGSIAEQYKEKYPDIIRVIHKENGGHGSAVNAGLVAATGTFFKVVDSDDWLDQAALHELMKRINDWEWNDTEVDMIVCNYIYNHLYENKTKVVSYTNVFPQETICNWNDIGRFHPSQYLVMHALVFRTAILREANVELPLHTFYVDNIFAYQPLPYVKNICYLNLDLYHYFLGREDQSVNEKVMMSRIDQQIKVTKIVSQCVNLDEVRKQYPKLAEYMTRNVSIMMAISSIHLLLIGTREAFGKRRSLWEGIKLNNPALYRKLKYKTLSGFTYLPGRAGGFLTVSGYRMAKRIYQFQ
jgi:glycosyltransferase involved in cell wall biosynthesis